MTGNEVRLRRCVSCGGWITTYQQAVSDGWQHKDCPIEKPMTPPPSEPTTGAVEKAKAEVRKAAVCLRLEVSPGVARDVSTKIEDVIAAFDAALAEVQRERDAEKLEADNKLNATGNVYRRKLMAAEQREREAKEALRQTRGEMGDKLLEARNRECELGAALADVAVPTLRYCERRFGLDDQARLNCQAALAATCPGPESLRCVRGQGMGDVDVCETHKRTWPCAWPVTVPSAPRCWKQARIASGFTQCVLLAPHEDKPCIFNVRMALPVVQPAPSPPSREHLHSSACWCGPKVLCGECRGVTCAAHPDTARIIVHRKEEQ